MKKILLTLLFLIGCNLQAYAFSIDLRGWKEISDKHFKVFYKNEKERESAQQLLNRAEVYYSSIADHIGYARYNNFWTWEQRVPILYFSSQEEYAKVTGRPAWSKGFSISHLSSVNLRMIVTYEGQVDFLSSTLPHEISHLILHDFIGANRLIPLWFDEGVAQLEETREDEQNYKILARLIAGGQNMSLAFLQNVNSGTDLDNRNASIFYAESLYIVDFLVKTYGRESFINLCRNLRNGKGFEESLRSAYYPALDSMVKLHDSWIKRMIQYL